MKKYLSLIILFLVSTSLVSAQGLDFNQNFEVSVGPPEPGPNTPVTIRIENYSLDLSKSDIAWYLDGKLVARGSGEKSFKWTTGALGKRQEVIFVVTTLDGKQYSKKYIFTPAQVDLFWQADSYIPPFYDGKALASSEAQVTVTAMPIFMPSGKRLDPAKLYYEWQINFEKVPGQSGIGRGSLPLKISSIFGETVVSVRVSTIDGAVAARSNITIIPTRPIVMVYRNDPLAGFDYDHPIGNSFSLTAPEVSLEAVGFFFSRSHTEKPGLSYTWTVGGKRAVVNEATPSSLTLRQESGAGKASVAVGIQDPFDSLLSATKNFLVEFSGIGSFQ